MKPTVTEHEDGFDIDVNMSKRHYNVGKNNSFYGKHHTPETKEKMRLAKLGIYDGENNNMYGRRHIKESIEKMRQKKLGKKHPEKTGEKHHNWKGDDAGLAALHAWVKRRLPKPDLCEICNKVHPTDLASVDHKYVRDLNQWQWLCKKCHFHSDGRAEKLYHNRWGKQN